MTRVNLAQRPHDEVFVVASGVDTLHLFTRALVNAERLQVLLEQRAQAEASGQRELVDVAGLQLEVTPWRLRKGAVLLTSDFYAVKVQPLAKGTDATVTVECRALALWSLGWRRAAEQATRLMAALAVGDLEVQVSRCDVAVDFQGWAPTPADEGDFSTRARSRGRYFEGIESPEWFDEKQLEAERARVLSLVNVVSKAKGEVELREALKALHHLSPAMSSDHAQGRRFTGFAWGRGGAVSARLYNKTLEARQSRKGHMRAVWRGNPDFVEAQDVWRLEFQFRREALRSLEAETPEVVYDLGSFDQLAQRLGALWKYGTEKWLWHGSRSAGDWKVFSPHWEALAAANIDHGLQREPETWRTDVARVVLEGAQAPVDAALAGYLASAMALQLERDTAPVEEQALSATMTQVLAAAFKASMRREDRAFVDKVEERRTLIRARRAHLSRRADSRARAQVRAVKRQTREASQPPTRYATWNGNVVKWSPVDDADEARARAYRQQQENAELEAKWTRDEVA